MTRNKRLLSIAGLRSCSLRERQVYAEQRPPALFGGHMYGTAVIADDAIDHGESHTGPLAHAFGREERLEHVRHVPGRNAASCVFDVNLQIPAFARLRMDPAA